MEIVQAEVRAIASLGSDYCEMELYTGWKNRPQPGQFITVYAGPDTLLKRPFGIAGYRNGSVVIIFRIIGAGTRWLSQRSVGDSVEVLGPLGNNFPSIDSYDEVIYVGGGIGLPPLFFHRQSISDDVHSVLCAGFKTSDERILTHRFEESGTKVFIATDDGSAGTRGFVTDILKKYLDSYPGKGIIFASGPPVMLRKVTEIIKEYNCSGYLCMESYMACGVGACNGCVQPVRKPDGESVYVKLCVDGPVINARSIIWE